MNEIIIKQDTNNNHIIITKDENNKIIELKIPCDLKLLSIIYSNGKLYKEYLCNECGNHHKELVENDEEIIIN